MLLTENLVQRYREWADRERDDEPDLVPRLRRLWTAPRAEPAAMAAHQHREIGLRRQPALESPRGI